MFKVLLKHYIYEACINVMFDKIAINFRVDKKGEILRLLDRHRELISKSLQYTKKHSENLSRLKNKDELMPLMEQYAKNLAENSIETNFVWDLIKDMIGMKE